MTMPDAPLHGLRLSVRGILPVLVLVALLFGIAKAGALLAALVMWAVP